MPKPDISWYKLGTEVSNLHSDLIIFGDVLKFPVVKAEHAGSYMCIAQNKAGNDQFEVELVVREAPKVKVEPEVDVFQVFFLKLFN